jgi:hypothetical protein
MQLSTNLPYALKHVREHIEQRGETRLPSNVSQVADEAYMADKGIRLTETLNGWPVGSCSRCSGTIHNAPFLSKSKPGEFCARECRDLQKQNRDQGTSHSPFQGMLRLRSQVSRKACQQYDVFDRLPPKGSSQRRFVVDVTDSAKCSLQPTDLKRLAGAFFVIPPVLDPAGMRIKFRA